MSDLLSDPGLVDWVDGPHVIVVAGRDDSAHVSQPHSHARGQLFGATRGLLTVGVADAVWLVPSSHAVWLPPHLQHWASSHGPFEGWGAYVVEPLCATLPAAACTVRLSGLLREAVRRAAAWPLERHAPLRPDQGRVLDVILDEIRALPPEPLSVPMPRDARLLRIAQALVADPASPRDLEQWAAWGALSARTLSRRFVLETGLTFSAWRQRARLMRALELLATGQPVGSVALDLGYATASAFIAAFRQSLGSTPSAFQQRLVGPGNDNSGPQPAVV